MLFSDAGIASAAIHVDWVMAMRLSQPANPMPPLDRRLAAQGWVLMAWVVGYDRVVRAGMGNDPDAGVNYGALLSRDATDGSEEWRLVLRGTNGMAEWTEDAEFVKTDGDGPGHVHHGFWGIFKSFELRSAADGRVLGPTFISGIAGLARRGLTIVGHSLGSPLAAYCADALVDIGMSPRLLALCCPRPGDAAWADEFELKMRDRYADYLVVDYSADVVPTMPPARLGFAALRRRLVLYPAGAALPPSEGLLRHQAARAVIRPGLGCNHHALSIAAMLDPGQVTEDYDCLN